MAVKSALIFCAAALLSAGAHAAPQAEPLQSVEQADRELARVARERAAIEAVFSAAEQVCYTKFWTTNCLDAAKEKRRSGLASLRVVEVEAERYKRKAAVDQRDRELAKSEQEFQEQQARIAAEPPKPPREAADAAPPKPAPLERAAQHGAKAKPTAAQDRADAAQRAANVAAFEKKRLDAEERQREVTAKKAEHDAKAAQDAKDAAPK
ncbi:MAG TPA: hypothetical protein VFG03_01570 [Telluria sp.]|nr:hypothetical protein [Telluria sp.]